MKNLDGIKCHDCGQKIGKESGCHSYDADGLTFVKCETCHASDPVLRNFRKTEVYSRVVGYIRPVDQWNDGKAAEFGDRKEFVVPDRACC